MSELLDVDARGLPDHAALALVGKATRYLAKGTLVTVSTDRADTREELTAWAQWAGHDTVALDAPDSIGVIVRAGVKGGEPVP